ncbi:allantoinase PuuE [Ketogulonicigenium vulgare]|nr:allantoinase PuuE [Ketogulonicigenium vulgare]ADO42124.1 urate catabolism protein [Ketogulonicigenium vulgare Y25]ALJ80527.1 polysaccharide deacetylase [Ketogulonicigenium vulgare]ANW34935.1 OHCU decarboxylase [Ketogulonicigenium vulgare]AOZ54044.1 urate catabolism protein [Ketogulonicigenium vulgare]
MPNRYPRDFRGHGPEAPDAAWPNGAKVAISLVLNYEEGGENNILHGDDASEAFLSDIAGAAMWPGKRHWNMESIYEYGARAGFWRLHRLFTGLNLPITIYGVATALARNPEQVAAMVDAGWEVASHGWKWVEHKDMPEEIERAQIAEAIRLHTEVVGTPPKGWYTGRCSANTVALTAETGAFDWISDTYDDDLPYWRECGTRDQLVIPYTLEANDMRFATAPGYIEGEQFYQYLKDTFDTLYAEGTAGHAKMFSVGLHNRLIGRPGKIAGLKRFLDYALSHDGVWFATRGQIAAHWAAHHPHQRFERPSEMDAVTFVARFGGIIEHSPWIAERAFALELGPAHDSAAGLQNALVRMLRSASDAEKLGVLNAHPDLAGKLAAAKRLTADSTAEQASAGLDALTDEERATFTRLNAAYVEKFGFPFIIAVRDHDKAGILAAFARRIANDHATEFNEGLRQVERIALLRLKAILP